MVGGGAPDDLLTVPGGGELVRRRRPPGPQPADAAGRRHHWGAGPSLAAAVPDGRPRPSAGPAGRDAVAAAVVAAVGAGRGGGGGRRVGAGQPPLEQRVGLDVGVLVPFLLVGPLLVLGGVAWRSCLCSTRPIRWRRPHRFPASPCFWPGPWRRFSPRWCRWPRPRSSCPDRVGCPPRCCCRA